MSGLNPWCTGDGQFILLSNKTGTRIKDKAIYIDNLI